MFDFESEWLGSKYAQELLNGLDDLENWPSQVKLMQKNWIGKSKGLNFNFEIDKRDEILEVFTTRPDTIFGTTYCAIASDHPLAIDLIEINPEVKKFIKQNKVLGLGKQSCTVIIHDYIKTKIHCSSPEYYSTSF